MGLPKFEDHVSAVRTAINKIGSQEGIHCRDAVAGFEVWRRGSFLLRISTDRIAALLAWLAVDVARQFIEEARIAIDAGSGQPGDAPWESDGDAGSESGQLPEETGSESGQLPAAEGKPVEQPPAARRKKR